MNPAVGVNPKHSRARVLLASAFVGLTVLAVWKFIEYRTEPPDPKAAEISSR